MSGIKKILLFGAGVASREVLRMVDEINLESLTWEVIGIVDKDPELIGSELDGLPILSSEDSAIKACTHATCSIYDPVIRKKVVENEIEPLGLKLATIISPQVVIPQDMRLEDGVMIYPGTKISFNVHLGKGALVFFNTLLGHDLESGNYSTVCPSATVNGSVTLGEGAFIGAGATIHQGTSIGDWSTIGIGSTILQDVGENKNVMTLPRQVVTEKK